MASTQVEAQHLLTVPEVAKRLRLSRWSVYRMIENGSLPAVRVSASPTGPLRVSASELESWLFSPTEGDAA